MKNNFDLIIIGAGVSGIFCCLNNQNNLNTLVLEKNKSCLKKFLITGKGKSNITNTLEPKLFLNNLIDANKFIYPSLIKYNSSNILTLLDELKIKYHEKTKNRIHLIDSNEVFRIKCLEFIEKQKPNVKLSFDNEVIDVKKQGQNFIVKTKKDIYECKNLIVATGGLSFKKTGSTGFGYELAKKFDHHINQLYPIGVGFKLKTNEFKSLQGQSLENVKVKVLDKSNKVLYEEVGPLMFTHYGIGGPIIRRVSGYVSKNILSEKSCEISISWIDKIIVESELNSKMKLTDCFKNYNSKLLKILLKEYYDNYNDLKNLKKATKQEIIETLINWRTTIFETEELELAINTGGGVDLQEINPNSMESTRVKNLFFIGEVLDINPRTNGFNITVCFATANKCIEFINEQINK